jgi:recombinational DNA repair ATPase RecF
MQLDLGNGQKMRVKFKDYAFFVPKNAAGKTAIIEGVAFKETIDVATLRHYAEDAGKSKEEIAKITQPREEINFEAKGVIIK